MPNASVLDFIRFQLVLCGALLLTGCASDQEDFGRKPPPADRVAEYTPQERARLAPSDIFQAVMNRALPDVEQISAKTPESLEYKNSYGDTALGLAIKLGFPDVAERLLKKIASGPELMHQNQEQQSYVYLAAQHGLPELITLMADAHFKKLGWLNNYEFADLDQPDNKGRTALFVASDRHVAEALESQYYRGLAEYPFWRFTLHEDMEHETFLHAAARDNRDDVLRWAAQRICHEGEWEASDSWYKRYPAKLLTYGLRTFQTYVGDVHSPVDLLFNRRNADGLTALHVAIQNRQWNSVRALTGCRWLDYDLPDAQGNLPLHTFLAAMNPLRAADQTSREVFSYLLQQNTQLRRITTGIPERVNTKNAQGDTPLHLAARLNDPTFYQLLAQFGDIYRPNAQGLSAEQIYQQQQRLKTQNAR